MHRRSIGVVCAWLSLVVSTSLSALCGTSLAAEKFPSREITVVVPLSPGGGVIGQKHK